MSGRRGRSQARRKGGNGMPGWAWLVIGLLLGAAALWAGSSFLDGDADFLRPRPNPDARPPDAADLADPPATDDAAAREPAIAAGDGARYVLQAGAFGNPGDAEAVKARIALLGLGARVESAALADGRTVYRVRLGPYDSAGALAEAKRKLAGEGLPSLAIRAN